MRWALWGRAVLPKGRAGASGRRSFRPLYQVTEGCGQELSRVSNGVGSLEQASGALCCSVQAARPLGETLCVSAGPGARLHLSTAAGELGLVSSPSCPQRGSAACFLLPDNPVRCGSKPWLCCWAPWGKLLSLSEPGTLHLLEWDCWGQDRWSWAPSTGSPSPGDPLCCRSGACPAWLCGPWGDPPGAVGGSTSRGCPACRWRWGRPPTPPPRDLALGVTTGLLNTASWSTGLPIILKLSGCGAHHRWAL